MRGQYNEYPDHPRQCQNSNTQNAKKKTKLWPARCQEMFRPSYITFRIESLMANSVDLDEVAHNEPPHLDLRSLQIQLFSFLAF